jgi:hypothetical protein
MEFVYLLLGESGSEWEDMIVFLSKEEAINQSIQYPNHRVEIFSKTNTSGYRATYRYYKNGELFENS